MSRENEEIARRYTEAVSARRVPEELLAPDFRIENVITAVTDRTYHGTEGVRQWIADFFDVLEDGASYEARPIASGDDFVVASNRIAGRGAASGMPVDLRFYGVAWIRDGKMVRAVGYPTRREAFAAVELED